MAELATELSPETPELTIVIASVNGLGVLEPTLEAIDALPERDRIEVIIVETLGLTTRARLASRRMAVSSLPSGER